MKIHIENYQGHEDTIIDADNPVTAIIGKSHHGKSSVERAVRWCVKNKPLGVSFVRKGTKRTCVSLDDVKHIRKGSSNYYELPDGSKPEALNGAVPKEVYEVLKLDEINIQDQHHSIFLLNLSAGKVAQELSKLIDLEAPQKVLKLVRSKTASLNSEYKVHKKLKETYENDLLQYESLDEYAARYAELESKIAVLAKKQATYRAISICIENATESLTRLNTIPKVDGLLTQATTLLNKINKQINDSQEAQSLHNEIELVRKLENARLPDYSKQLSSWNLLLKTVHGALITKARNSNLYYVIRDVRKLRNMLRKVDPTEISEKLQDAYASVLHFTAMGNSINKLVSIDKNVIHCQKLEEQADAQLKQVRKEIGNCPYCGGSM